MYPTGVLHVELAWTRSGVGGEMAYAIELIGDVRSMQQLGLADLVGHDAMSERGGRVTLRVLDQPAMLGVLNRLNDLGIEIEGIART
jgi:hypothetical protein